MGFVAALASVARHRLLPFRVLRERPFSASSRTMPSGGDWKALYEAASQGDLDAVNRWLAAGVDPNFQHPEFGTTPLIAASEAGQLDAVKLLVEQGARPGVVSEWDGVTALEAAQARGHAQVVAYLRPGS